MQLPCRRRYGAAFIFFAFTIGSLRADTVSTWTGGGNGNWSDPADWSPAVVPNNTTTQSYDVAMKSGVANLDVNATVNRLTFGSGGYVSLGADPAYPYPWYDLTLTVHSGNLNLANLPNGQSNAPFFPVPGGGGDSLVLGGNLVNSINYVQTGTLSVGGNFTNSGNLSLYTDFSIPSGFSVSGTLTNTGTIILGDIGKHGYAIGQSTTLGSLVNKGFFGVAPDTTVSVGGLGLTDIAKGSTLFVAGTFNGFQNLSTIEGVLTLLSPTTLGSSRGTLSNSGTMNLGAGVPNTTITVARNLSNSGTLMNGDLFNETNYPTNGVNLIVNGTLTNQASGTINFTDLSNAQLNAQKIVNYGNTNFGQGNIVNTQVLENYGNLPIYGPTTTGTLKVQGDGLNVTSGSLVVGSGAATPASGEYEQLANGTLEFAGANGGFGVGAETASLDGTLDIMLGNGAKPVGEVFYVLDASSFTGSFSTVQGLVFDGGRQRYILDYDTADGEVTLTVANNTTPEPGSFFLVTLCMAATALTYRCNRDKVSPA